MVLQPGTLLLDFKSKLRRRFETPRGIVDCKFRYFVWRCCQ